MLNVQTFQIPLLIAERSSNHMELGRVLAAAVVNRPFCQLLLDDPELALQNGYQGEAFFLNNEERALILSIRADSLKELAGQLTSALSMQSQAYPLSFNG